jgi:hypothetical protein
MTQNYEHHQIFPKAMLCVVPSRSKVIAQTNKNQYPPYPQGLILSMKSDWLFQIHFQTLKKNIMALQEDFLNLTKGKLTQAKAFLEELEVQMALGKAEAKDAFQSERKNLSKFLNKQKALLKDVEKISAEHKKTLLTSLENLEAQLATELPTTKGDFDKFKKGTLEIIYRLEANLTEAYGDLSDAVQEELDDFKVKLDAYRVKLALGDIKDQEALVKRKSELQEEMSELRKMLQKESSAGDRMDLFTEEINQSFTHMKKAFSDLFD